MRHDKITALQESFDANRRAIALAHVPEAAVRNFEAMSIGERRFAHYHAEAQALRHDKLAATDEALGRDPGYNRQCAANRRITAAALKAIGL